MMGSLKMKSGPRDASPDSVIAYSRRRGGPDRGSFAVAVTCVRVCVACVVVGPFAAPAPADAVVAAVYRRVYGWRVAHHCMFEAGLATWGFFQAIALFQVLDSVGPVCRRFRADRARPVP